VQLWSSNTTEKDVHVQKRECTKRTSCSMYSSFVWIAGCVTAPTIAQHSCDTNPLCTLYNFSIRT
jgi:hypothetical protein